VGVLSGVVLIFLSSNVVPNPHVDFLVVPVLHSVSDIFVATLYSPCNEKAFPKKPK
jgi:hypothetical protein